MQAENLFHRQQPVALDLRHLGRAQGQGRLGQAGEIARNEPVRCERDHAVASQVRLLHGGFVGAIPEKHVALQVRMKDPRDRADLVRRVRQSRQRGEGGAVRSRAREIPHAHRRVT